MASINAAQSSQTAQETNKYSAYLQVGSQVAQNIGLDSKYSTQIGNILNGNSDAALTNATDGVIDSAISDPVANAVAKGVVDIVKTVLIGKYDKGADVKEAQTNLNNIQDTGNTTTQLADTGTSAGEQILASLQGDIDTTNAQIDEAANTITLTTADGTTQIIQINESNLEAANKITENKAEIEKNNSEIEQKQSKLQELSSQISAKKAALNIPTEAPAPKSTQGSENAPDGSKTENKQEGNTTPFMSTDGIEDSELKNLITEYNALGVDIAGLQQTNQALTSENATLTENIQNNVETATQTQTEQIEVSQEAANSIDEAATEIVSLANDAQSAINEVQNLLKGQFPTLDKVALVKLATSVTKSAICGTNSGLLATAAAAMGASSIVSFGATAQKAAELTSASVDQAAGSAKHIATNVAGKLIEQQMQKYMSQTFANISQMTGVDLTQMQSLMNEFIQLKQSESSSNLQAFEQLKVPQEENSGTQEVKTA